MIAELRCYGAMLRTVDENLWVAEQPLRFAGLSVGARMTVIRLAAGELFVHSPVRLDDELRAEVSELGRVRWLIAPNRFHHLSVGDWQAAFPDARAYAAPGLAAKRKDLAFAGVLDDGESAPWAGAIDQVAWRGVPVMNEVVFLHRASRTLVMTDTVHNLGSDRPWWTRTVFRALGGFGGFKSTLADRMLTRDLAASRASLEKILSWDFDRVILAHGHILDGGGPAALRHAYRWLLPAA